MGYENDPFTYRDGDGEPLMDFDEDIQSEPDKPQQHLLDDEEGALYHPRNPQLQWIMAPGGDDDVARLVRDDYSDGGQRKREKGEERKSVEKKRKGEKGEKKFKVRKSGGGRMRDHGPILDERDSVRTMDDDNSISDSGVDLADCMELTMNILQCSEIALLVEKVMAELEVLAEEDVELNRLEKAAINKLKKLSLLTDVLSELFLDHAVLTFLKNWLEPLPDGSLLNIMICAAVLKILNDFVLAWFPIDLEQYDRREQLKKSGLGKVRSVEETTANRKLAKELFDKWLLMRSRPIFNKSTRFEDLKNIEDERIFRRPSLKAMSLLIFYRVISKAAGMASRDDDLDLSSSRQQASRPEAMSMNFVVHPQFKVDPDEVQAWAKQIQPQCRTKVVMAADKEKSIKIEKFNSEDFNFWKITSILEGHAFPRFGGKSQ
ncbi:hypothetical protein Pfo_015300 [Paulownia fortunei]|nr:hypothetical protein Pfo_015300 [Paulownia fortunei]